MSFENLLRPASVAVVGASADPAKVGHAVLANLVAGEFQGPIYPVNPRPGEILGLRTNPSLGTVPGPVDLAVVVVPRDKVIPVLQEASTPACAVWMGGLDVSEGVRLLNEGRVPVFETPERAVNTLMYMFQYSRNLELLQETPPNSPPELHFDRQRARAIVQAGLS